VFYKAIDETSGNRTEIVIGPLVRDFSSKYADEVSLNLMGFNDENEFREFMDTLLVKLDQLRMVIYTILVRFFEDKPHNIIIE